MTSSTLGSTVPIEVWLGLLPAVLGAAYFVGGLAIYAIRVRLHGELDDREMSTRGSSRVLVRFLRLYFVWVTRPVWVAIRRCNVPADAVTSLSLLLALSSAVLISVDRTSLGGWLFVLAGVLDFLDGRLARARGEATAAGAALDSVLDRFADAAVLIGLAWLYRGTWVLVPVLVAVVGCLGISYVRARGEGLGVNLRGGLMQRPERIALIGSTLILTPLLDLFLSTPDSPGALFAGVPHLTLACVLVFLAVATNLTAAWRLAELLRALDASGRRPTWGVLLRRGSVIRSLIASLVATGADFLAVLAMVGLGTLPPWLATALGCILGGVINFSIGRFWAFHARGRTTVQASRYVMVSVSSAVLNAGGVAVLALTALDYRIAWLGVRAVVFLGWNYPLHRDYVFDAAPPDETAARAQATVAEALCEGEAVATVEGQDAKAPSRLADKERLSTLHGPGMA